MTLFFLSAALLVLLCIGWLLLGLFRSTGSDTDQEAVNITLARERREVLDTALADGAIDQATYDYERKQLEYDLAADLRLEKASTARPGGQLSAAVLVAVFVPICAGALYLHLGDPAAIAQHRTQPGDAAPTASVTDGTETAPALTELLPQMEERLAQQPDDIEGWRLLGRSYLSVGEFGKARNAFEKALALDEDDVPTMTQLAESIGMTQQGELAGEPAILITQALTLDPDNEHALWLGSIAQQQVGNHDAALQGFNRLAVIAQNDPEAMATIEQMRSRSIAAMAGLQQGDRSAGSAEQPASESTAASEPADAGEGASIAVTVSLSEEAGSSSSEEQVVFVYARATDGPPMPLAVSRISVADLPTTVTLDNSMAMIPTMTLSTFPSVTIGARVSTTGTAAAQSGDWFKEAGDIDPVNTDSVELTIDQQTP